MNDVYISALTTAYASLKKQIEVQDYEANYADCFYAIGTMLHWLLDVVERLYDDKSKYCEFRFINNQLKHNHNIIELHSVDGGLFFPEDGIPFGIINDDGMVESTFAFPAYELIWKEFSLTEIDERYNNDTNSKNQYIAYQKKLENKNILDTFTAAYEDIINELGHR